MKALKGQIARHLAWVLLGGFLALGLAVFADGAHAQDALLSGGAVVGADAPDGLADAQCRPQLLGVYTAVHGADVALDAPPPDAVWAPVTLPHAWRRSPQVNSDIVWYRLDWLLPCQPSQAVVGVATEGFSLAGVVYSNGELLWRDQQLTEPLSRSWNMPRYWMLPASSLLAGHNTLWFRVHGLTQLPPGLWETRVGPLDEIRDWFALRHGVQRSLPMLNIAVTGVLGLTFLFFWILRRRETTAGWFAFMALSWNVFMSSFVALSPWPLPDNYAVVRVIAAAFTLYTSAFVLFTWRFAELRYPRSERALWCLTGAVVLLLALAPPSLLVPASVWVFGLYGGLFIANCVVFQRVARRSRDFAMRLMAVCLLSFIPIGLLDFLDLVGVVVMPLSLTPWSAPITATMMAFILAWRFTRHQNQIERFNQDLSVTVARTRDELTSSLQSRHTLALRNVRLEERLQIAHDLHDGMGSTLIRTIAQIEHAQTPPEAGHLLSALKSMRDDLRQIIDSGTSEAAIASETPGQWLAPLRHRFVRLLEALGVASEWQVPPHWPVAPSAAQCLALTRFVEEAMTNAIKHARAQHVWLRLESVSGGMLLCIEDDGIGFDLDAVLNAGMSVGIHSMRRRIARIGGTLDITSIPGKTRLCVFLGATASPSNRPQG